MTEAIQTDLFSGIVQPLFEEHRADFLSSARAAARAIATSRGEVTINDVRAVCPPPKDVDPRVMGAVLRTPEFEVVRYERSARAECHNRPIAVFRLVA